MPDVCLCFQVHQPYRLRRYSVYETDRRYFDEAKNAEIIRRVAHKCYVPAANLLRELVEKHQGRFKLAFSLTGVVVEQLHEYCPEALEAFRRLFATGCVELLSETYYHSLAAVYSPSEFVEQVNQHRQMVEYEFGQCPAIFRNTELIYNNDLARRVAQMGYQGILAEGVERVLGPHPASFLRHPPGCPEIKILLRDHQMADDVAFRFSDRSHPRWPMFADRYAQAIGRLPGPVCNIFFDFEALGEHQGADTGIFEFLRHLPDEVLKRAEGGFVTPSEAVERFPSAGELDVPEWTSWADVSRDLSAWLGNGMQLDAARKGYGLEKAIKAQGDPDLLRDWRRLTISDHYYYMSTKDEGDGLVHKYFNPYQSEYDSYINYMNVLESFVQRLETSCPLPMAC